MAAPAPTQEYPDWLSPSRYATTLANGAVDTATTIVYLPLTYYGPSIPLGEGVYTYGGLTSPASTATATTSNTPTAPPPTSSPIPSTSPATPPKPTSSSPPSPSTSSTLSGSSASSSASVSSSSSPPLSSASSATSILSTASSAPTSSSSVMPGSGRPHFPDRGATIGLIVAGLLVGVGLVIFAWFMIGKKKRRATRLANAQAADASWFDSKPRKNDLDDDFVIIGSGGNTPEGSPRHSGEEADPFLLRTRSQDLSHRTNSSQGTRGSLVYTDSPPLSIPEMGVAFDHNIPQQGTRSSHTMSDLGVPIEGRSGSPVPAWSFVSRQILSPQEQRNLDSPATIHEMPEPLENSPLMPPPRLVDPEPASIMQNSLPLSKRSFRSMKSNRSSLPLDAEEAVMLQTARRVNIEEELGMRPTVRHANLTPSTSAPSGGWLPALGLGALANRFSWLNNASDAGSRRTSMQDTPPSTWAAHGVVDRDVEAGRPLLTTQSQEFRSSRGIIGIGLGPGGARPQSGANSSVNSARTHNSGSTVYHDAMSSVPELRSTLAAPSSAADVLDTPAPHPLRTFASTSSMRDTGTNRTGDTTTESSLASKKSIPFPPPGLLDISTLPKVWTETSGRTPSPGSYGGHTPPASVTAGRAEIPYDLRSSVTIDVLEDEPPVVQHNFARILGFHAPPHMLSGAGQRTTFGASPTFNHSPEHSSEVGSLHSNRSLLSPTHSRSVGSSGGSHSKGSSHNSRRTGSSGLSHSGSISSDGRLRGKLGTTRRDPPMSPALSALGEQGMSAVSLLHQPSRAAISRSSSRGMSPDARAVSPSSVSRLPWAAGLDDAWNAA